MACYALWIKSNECETCCMNIILISASRDWLHYLELIHFTLEDEPVPEIPLPWEMTGASSNGYY